MCQPSVDTEKSTVGIPLESLQTSISYHYVPQSQPALYTMGKMLTTRAVLGLATHKKYKSPLHMIIKRGYI